MHQGLVTEGDKRHIHADRSPVLIKGEKRRCSFIWMFIWPEARLVRRSQVMASKFGLIAETIAARTEDLMTAFCSRPGLITIGRALR